MHHEDGFTLTELITTLALLGLMVLISVPIMDNVLSDSEDSVDESLVGLIESAASVAGSNGVLHDEPVRGQYKVRRLIESGNLASDDEAILDHWVIKDGDGYKYIGEREAAPESDFIYRDLTWMSADRYAELTTDPERLEGVEIMGYTGPGGVLVIPETLGGKPVVRLAHSAFMQKGLTEVYVPENTLYIDDHTFNGNALTSMYVPQTLRIIDMGAFRDNQLTAITLPRDLEHLDGHAFTNNRMHNVDMSHLTRMTSMQSYVFYDTRLKALKLPPNIVEIGAGAFQGAKIEEIAFPESLKVIHNNAFYYNNLRSVVLPHSVETVGTHAFAFNGLTYLRLSNNLTEISDYAFYTNNLTEVNFWNNGKLKRIGTYAFHTNDLRSVEIYNGVTHIDDNAFRRNQLGYVKLPKTLKEIGYAAFYDNNLGRVEGKPAGVTEGGAAFGLNHRVEFK